MTQYPLRIAWELWQRWSLLVMHYKARVWTPPSTITASRRLHNQKLNMVHKIQYYAMKGAQTVNLVFITPRIRTLQT